MSSNRQQISVKVCLNQLREKIGDSEFGYRMQAVFAHVLIRLGGDIEELNAQGHPDIKATLGDRKLLVQVKTVAHRSASSKFELGKKDIDGIKPLDRQEGVLAVLDCAEPVQWVLIDYHRALPLVRKSLHLATIRAECNKAFSDDCTLEFFDLIDEIGTRLKFLTWEKLQSKALKNEKI